MESKRLFALLISICLLLVLGMLTPMLGCPSPGTTTVPEPTTAPETTTPGPTSKPIELTSVGFGATQSFVMKNAIMFNDLVNQRAKGELRIEHLGGPEVFPPLELARAVQAGQVDLGYTVSTFYTGIVKEANFLALSRITQEEEREVGFHDLFNNLHMEAGLVYLGRQSIMPPEPHFYIGLTKKRVSTLDDLDGLILARGGTLGATFAKSLGMGSTLIALPEMYTALDRGVADAGFTAVFMWVDMGPYEAIQYVLDHPVYSNDNVAIMNLDAWNRLPEHLQKLMRDTFFELQPQWASLTSEAVETRRQQMQDAGIQFVKLSPEEGKLFVEIAYGSEAEEQLENCPEYGPQIVQMLEVFGE
jgi:TRAP-type C4-dicarboxylate transport system substrate-binding protein